MKVYDVWNGNDSSFIMRAPGTTLQRLMRIDILALRRVDAAKGEAVVLHGNGKHDDYVVKVREWEESL